VADPPATAAGSRVVAAPSEAALDPVMRKALGSDYGAGSRTTALLVLRDGEAIGEAYQSGLDPATPQRTWSVAKSIAATLVGVAVHKQQVDVNAPGVHDAWLVDARNAITIDHLLRMASGRYSDTPGNRTDPLYWGGSTVEESAAIWPLIHQPGTVFRYANNDTLMAVKAVSDRVEDFAPEAFFKAVGMDHTVAETDWMSDYILSSQVWTTARDLAKFGQLYLNNGKLPSGERILPEDWVRYVTTPSGPQPTSGTFGYGAGFWLLNKEEGVPSDTFAAIGNRGQYVVIVPSRQVVIVRRGEDPAGSGFNIAAFTRDVLAALPE
ncbi:MAG: beta-lactamase family protein, partial [Erythrobacter sp.]|uniref:serine hydrolase domain-containing protein n=1 Tax=Erythrobacter sp. TaxID=1042 RepID=UPI0025CF2AF2